MATLGQVFKRKDLPEDVTLTAGWHTVTIVNCTIKTAKSGGKYLLFLLTNRDGYVCPMITIENSEEQSVNIGMKQLRSLMTAVGIDLLSDTDQLIGRMLKVEVVIKEDATYGAQPKVKKYASVNANTTVKPAGVACQDPEPTNDMDDVIPF